MGMMNRVGPLVGTALLSVVLAAVAVACGGGGDEATVSPTPDTTGTPAGTPSAVEEQLNRMVLQLSDLPAGFTTEEGTYSTNEDVASAAADPEAELATLTEWGRILGHNAIFSPDPNATNAAGVFIVESTVSLYENDSGASASFADAVDTARTTDWPATISQATDLKVEELPSLDVGDEMLWFRISGTAPLGEAGTEQAFVEDMALLRVGRGRGSISMASAGGDAATQLMESLIRIQAANIEAGLR
jgi:hypothetical protein